MKCFHGLQTLVAGLGLLLGSSSGFAANWTATSDGDWFDAGNWDTTPPNATDAAADFTASIGSNLEVNLHAPATVGSVLFSSGNASSYSITGGNTLTLNVSSGRPLSAEGTGTHVNFTGNNTGGFGQIREGAIVSIGSLILLSRRR